MLNFNQDNYKGVYMPYKIMMSILATVPLIFLLAFFAIPEFFVLNSYPNGRRVKLWK
jgi:hypothetical protein